MPVDPDWNNLKLLLHCNGTHNGTTFVDSSPVGRSITVGSTTTVTDQSKFGGASAYFGVGNLSIASSTDFDFGAGAYTIEFWLRLGNGTNPYGLLGRSSGNTGPWRFRTSGGVIYYEWTDDNGTFSSNINGGSLSANTWYHIAVSDPGTAPKLFVNGTQVGRTGSRPNSFTASSVVLDIGRAHSLNRVFGWMDEVAIWKGAANYSGSFTPSSGEWTEPTGKPTHAMHYARLRG